MSNPNDEKKIELLQAELKARKSFEELVELWHKPPGGGGEKDSFQTTQLQHLVAYLLDSFQDIRGQIDFIATREGSALLTDLIRSIEDIMTEAEKFVEQGSLDIVEHLQDKIAALVSVVGDYELVIKDHVNPEVYQEDANWQNAQTLLLDHFDKDDDFLTNDNK